MEHFYHTIDGFMNHRNQAMLDRVISEFPPGGTWVELGSWTGKSAAYCVVELMRQQRLGPFYCVDNWSGGHANYDVDTLSNVRDIFCRNMLPISQHVTMMEHVSWQAAQQFADLSVDFCYVDAGHDYDSVTNDLTAWWPKIREGAYFGGDDYTKGYAELQQAVWDFFGPKDIRVSRMGRCWIVKKC
jgi:hypothetical protein